MSTDLGMKRVAIYARVSTKDQNPETQLQPLRQYVVQMGWTVIEEIVDLGVSGTKARRPGLDRLMELVRKRKIDIVVVWKLDRFARSTSHLVSALEEMKSLNIRFSSYTENIDFGSPMGTAMFTVIAAMAQLERDIIVERVKAGLARVRREGKILGAPEKRDYSRIEDLLREGKTAGEIANILQIPKSTARFHLRKLREAEHP